MKLVKIKETNLYSYISDSSFDDSLMFDLSSNIYYWDDYLNQDDCKIDFITVKEKLKSLYDTNGFDSFKDDEKILLSKYNVPTEAEISTVMDRVTRLLTKSDYDGKIIRARQARFILVKNEFVTRVTNITEQMGVMADIDKDSLASQYINFGVRGISRGDVENGIYDYILGVNGYEGIGLKDKTFTEIIGGWDSVELANRLVYLFDTRDIYYMGYTNA